MKLDSFDSLRQAISRSGETWMNRCRELDRDLLLSALDQADAEQWAYSPAMDRAFRLQTCTYAVAGTPDQQDVITALLGARVLAFGHYRHLDLDGWPPRLYAPILFITSVTGRLFLGELRGER